jgi:hypothetical protein
MMDLSPTLKQNVVETIVPEKSGYPMLAEVSKCVIALPQRIQFNNHTQFLSVNYMGPSPCLSNIWVGNNASLNANNETKNCETKSCHSEDKLTIRQTSGSENRNIDFRDLPVPDTIPIVDVQKMPSRKQKRADLIAELLEEEAVQLKRDRKDDISDAKEGDKSHHTNDSRNEYSGGQSTMFSADDKNGDSSFSRRGGQQLSKNGSDQRDRRTSYK